MKIYRGNENKLFCVQNIILLLTVYTTAQLHKSMYEQRTHESMRLGRNIQNAVTTVRISHHHTEILYSEYN